MTALPDIPRLYTALAECLAVLLFTPALAPRFSRAVTGGITLLWAAVLSAFLGLTGDVPGGLWIPCMVTAIGLSYLYLWGVWSITLLEAGYHCARAFILAELAASVEWQLHCALWPARGPWEPLSLLLLALVYGALFGIMCYLQHRRPQPAGHLQIGGSAALTAVMLALTALCGEQSGISARQRDQHEHFFHPHLGGFFRRADLICAARAAAGERFAQRACRHGRGAAPPVRAVQAQQGGHQPHQPAVP